MWWSLKPDGIDDDEELTGMGIRRGVFLATKTFFLVNMLWSAPGCQEFLSILFPLDILL